MLHTILCRKDPCPLGLPVVLRVAPRISKISGDSGGRSLPIPSCGCSRRRGLPLSSPDTRLSLMSKMTLSRFFSFIYLVWGYHSMWHLAWLVWPVHCSFWRNFTSLRSSELQSVLEAKIASPSHDELKFLSSCGDLIQQGSRPAPLKLGPKPLGSSRRSYWLLSWRIASYRFDIAPLASASVAYQRDR